MGTKTQGTLFLIGGAEDKQDKCEVLRKFVKLSGGEDSHVIVITSATLSPVSVGQDYLKVFQRLGAGSIEILELDSRQKADNNRVKRQMEKASGIFFTGGDQLRLTSILGGTLTDEEIKRAYRRGAVIAGTSAGASVMSETMIVEGDSDQAPKLNTIKMAPGLGLLAEALVDQHFAQRGRIGRLLSAIAHNPYILGIGIDEDTAVVIGPDGQLEVFGSQTVTVLDGRNVAFTNVSELSPGQALAIEQVILHVLPRGYGFDLNQRRPVSIDGREGEHHENN